MNGVYIISIALDLVVIGAFVFLCFRNISLQKQKDNEYYTDYIHKGHILRVFKPEFEYEAVGNVPIGKILDRGALSQYYLWALIEK